MPKDQKRDQEDRNTSTSDVLRNLDQFVEQQAKERFLFDRQLETNFALHRRFRPGSETSSRDADERDKSLVEAIADGSYRSEERERTIQAMWDRLHQLRQSDGIAALYDLKSRLEAHQDEQKQKLHTVNTKITAVGWYQDVMEKKGGGTGSEKTMIEVFPPSSFGEELSGPVEPRCYLKWRKDPGEEFKGNGNDAIGRGEIRMRQSLDDPDFSYPLKFDPGNTVKEIWAKLRGMRTRCEDAWEERGTICRLIDLRKTLLDRFLWTFEVAGGVPREVTVSVSEVPEKFDNNPKALRHACIILELLPDLPNASLSVTNPPTKGELKESILTRIDLEELGRIQPQSVINGAARLLKTVLNDRGNKKIDKEFWRLLNRHQDALQTAAEKMGLDIPAPVESESSSSSDT